MRNRGWIVLASVVLVIGIILNVRASAPRSSPEHSSTADSRDGASAIRLLAESLGHPTSAIEGQYALPEPPGSTAQGALRTGLLFVFTPTRFFSAEDAATTKRWVEQGGVLIYATEQGDASLAPLLGIGYTFSQVDGDARGDPLVLDGVHDVIGADLAYGVTPKPHQVPILRNPKGDVLGAIEKVGSGRVVILTNPLELCNFYLNQKDNWRLAADLLGLVPTTAPVFFDEYHHGAGSSAGNSPYWLTTPWGAGLAWVVLAVFTGLALRGRPFGPHRSLAPERGRSTAEYAVAVGHLLRRSGGRRLVLDVLLAAARRAAAERVGVGRRGFANRSTSFDDLLARRAPDAGSELSRARNEIDTAARSEAGLLSVARRLHRVAYPIAETRPKEDSE
jgi:hypothetical protein